MPRYNKSKYTAEKSSEIRFNIIGALDELAINKPSKKENSVLES